MASVPFDAEGWEYLTPRERVILVRLEREFSHSDPRLVDALRGGVLPVPAWLVGVVRAALLLSALVLLLPFAVWSSILVLVALIMVVRLRRHSLRR